MKDEYIQRDIEVKLFVYIMWEKIKLNSDNKIKIWQINNLYNYQKKEIFIMNTYWRVNI